MGASFTPELIRLLRAASCRFERPGKGDHDIWYSPITERHLTVDGKLLSRHTANAIMKQAGIAYRFRAPHTSTSTHTAAWSEAAW